MNRKIQKILLVILLFVFLNSVFAPPARADFWGATMAGEIWKQTTEMMIKSIQDTILAQLKMAALRIVQTRLMSLLGSSSSQIPGVAGYIISDWKMFIYSSAQKYSTQVTNDFFRGLSSGAPTAIQQRIISPVRSAVSMDYWSMQPNLQYYVTGGQASNIFSPGATTNPWTAWRMAAMPQNDLAFTYLRAAGFKESSYQQEAAARQAEGVAGQGLKGKEKVNQGPAREAIASNGRAVSVPAGSDYKGQNITTPGSVIGSLTNEVNSMPIKMLTLARSVPEVVTAMVNQLISQIIQKGLTQMISPSGSSSSSSVFQNSLNSASNQAQQLIQNGIRSAASPRMLFGQ